MVENCEKSKAILTGFKSGSKEGCNKGKKLFSRVDFSKLKNGL
jgi:hypothetical protein